jgi:hypothetical protein
MNDWIDNEKATEDAQAEEWNLKSQLRLHTAKLISTKSPESWEAVIECLRADSNKLRTVYPSDLSKQCSLSTDGLVHTLQGCKIPWRILQMRLNIASQTVDVDESRKESRDRTVLIGRDQISLRINAENGLEYQFRGVRYLMPDQLAQDLIKYVRGG